MPCTQLKCILLSEIVLHTGCWAQEVRVSQPGSVRAPEGGSVTLPCRYNSSRPAALGSYRWVKEEAGARLEVSDATLQFRGRVNGTPSRSFLQDRRADVRLRDLRPYDAGTYRCWVKIPTVGEGEGNGTRLLVVKADTPSLPPDSPALGTLGLWLGTAVGVAFGVAVLLWICRKRRKDRRDARPRTEALVQPPRCPTDVGPFPPHSRPSSSAPL
uniref:Natural cytotoxicity triggering receptor 3 n=1 Tax=Pelodiscus sinensis TaxID=13735 RepID=K7FB57_PELSI